MATKFNQVTSELLCPVYLDPLNVNTITLSDAIIMTTNFRDMIKKPSWPYDNIRGYIVSLDSIEKIKALTPNIKHLKIYFGEKEEDGKKRIELIVLGAYDNADDFDIPETGTSTAAIFADTRPCPIHCGKGNVLNPKPNP